MDVTLCLAVMPLALPLMAVLGLAVALVDGRPVFFRQERVGRRGRPLAVVKFRTMRPGRELGRGYLEKERITVLGSFLRRTHLDETPQLFLVLNGAMSFVGPRPLLAEQMGRCRDAAARQAVPPGLTGPAQLKLYREGFLDIDEQFILDEGYTVQASLVRDAAIVVETVVLLTRRLFN